MKGLKDRHEIAEAINVKMLPVLTMDISESLDGYDGCYEGSKCRVKYQTRNHGEQWTEGKIWCENGEYSIIGGGFGIHERFSYEDMMGMVETANTPMLEEGQEVVVVLHIPEYRTFTAIQMMVADVRPNCITRCRLV